jgi:dipeptidase E
VNERTAKMDGVLRLLLLSNSKNFGGSYLGHAEGIIKSFLGRGIEKVLFVPFAAVRVSYDEFAATVRSRFEDLGYGLESVHAAADPRAAVVAAQAIVVGGGNTFHLLLRLYETGLLEAIRARARDGVPYMGWSAGANIAGLTIKTTNDMPIVQPPSLDALALLPFQLNPHYTDAVIPNHAGETRAERIAEFLVVNPGVPVVALREGSTLRVEGSSLELLGERSARVFRSGREPDEVQPGSSLEVLLR